MLPAAGAAPRRGRLCRRAVRGGAGARRDADRGPVPAQLYRRQPRRRRSRSRPARRPVAVHLDAAPGHPRRSRAPPCPARHTDLRPQAQPGRRARRGSSATTRPITGCSTTTCDRLHREFGAVWHINCHSMPSHGNAGKGAKASTAISCSATATARPARRNSPISSPDFCAASATTFASTRATRASRSCAARGARRENRHSLQIEVDRSLYMDQKTLEKLPGFDRLQSRSRPPDRSRRRYVQARL